MPSSLEADELIGSAGIDIIGADARDDESGQVLVYGSWREKNGSRRSRYAQAFVSRG